MLEADGHSAAQAKELLGVMRATLALMKDHRDLIAEDMGGEGFPRNSN